MPSTLGKRKRISREDLEKASRSPSPSTSSEQSDSEDLQDIFRRAFESKFKPLDIVPSTPKADEVVMEKEYESEAESEWSGISDAEGQVEVIEYTTTHNSATDDSSDEATTKKLELRSYMSAKPPILFTSSTSQPNPTSSKKQKRPVEDADATETAHLKQDVALQKLLRESHLLSRSASTTAAPSGTTSILQATGLARHKSHDLHLQTLGASSSIYTQKNMPMAQRKHMAAKARMKEERRRAEAREGGVVLEKEVRVGKVERRGGGGEGEECGRAGGGSV